MPRKVVQGPIRDKEKTKQKLLAAVGKILRTKGYSGLKVSKIAAVAGFDKKLIYEYFGSTEKLIDEYIRSQDYWSRTGQEELHVDFSDGGKEMSKVAILNQFEQIRRNKELQKIILWGLSEGKPILKKVADDREEAGELLFKNIVDPHFKDKSTRYRAIAALLVSGAYYLNLYTAYNASVFCGIDLKSEDGRKEIEKAITEIIDFAYEEK
ncbi:TetR family transcriptional regulator [Chryseobacterium sp. Leaf405]|uniref:TetR/AcrR family transcriptional regulator n=1 Tax=Chryseobacterium sp. Leaf405 TaxID=1736367 RepID=UPI0006F7CD28|nr:TetR/AcrR family transcriptional regulator [Chryseobacterium sp. Leaf405]KQT35536.1 TetR family transcriptional regulator [Chryseobacterium sp. Leaf405]